MLTRTRDLSQEVASEAGMPPCLSLVLPVFNESENLPPLHAQIKNALDNLTCTYEIIYIDDGSTDQSFAALSSLASADDRVKVIRFRRNHGQTPAIAAGIAAAAGDIIVTLDADLQNDPHDIARLLAKLDEGYDVVSGWRKKRRDRLVTRKIPSWMANALISRLTGVALHDYGCTLKAYRADIIKQVRLYGEMHRLIPAYAALQGARVAEIVVNHRERRAGKTKYGLSRTLRVLLDLLLIKFLSGYGSKPMHFFGGLGAASCGFGIAGGMYTIYEKIALIYFHREPLIVSGPLLSVMFFLVGVQLLTMGFLAEILIRIYHESQGKPTFTIRETRNLPAWRDLSTGA